jgi:hypothetical protein
MSDLNEFIKNSPCVVKQGKYAYLQGSEQQIKNHFLICKDADETTIITKEKNISGTPHEKDVKWFKLIEFKTSVPFKGVGFIAKISETIASAGLNILVVSTFSKDYILVHEEELDTALKALEKIGFIIEIEK